MSSPRPTATGAKQLAAVATAAIPVVMLSSLSLAGPAAAAPAKAEMKPSGSHGALNGKAIVAAVQARTLGSNVSVTAVASSVPRAVTAMSPGQQTSVTGFLRTAPATVHTVAAGETVSGIAAGYGVSTGSVLERNNMAASDIIHPGQLLQISGTAPAAQPDAGAGRAPSNEYIVKAGDTLSGIAASQGTSLESLYSLNGLNHSSVIHPGQAVKFGASPAAPAPAAASEKTPAPSGTAYVIKAGDTLSSIAAAHNVSLGALVAANNADANATIYPGKTLQIPGVSAAASNITPITAVPETAPVELTPEQQVPSTFLHYTYPQAVVNDANRNKLALLSAPSPNQEQMKEMVARTAASMGVDPALAMAFAMQESGFNHQSVSPANAIGTMQVIPDAGDWASGLVGRTLNLLDPQDNVTAGVAIIRALQQGGVSEDEAIAGYYQGQYSVSVNGLFPDTVNYVAGIKANRELFR
ncbi:LysM repeat protein [Arthrobacter stackebrandtii]|uniref:LysM repeat protein n=1 Tax=Arthrobacter stackebrandtii TaxID=272161 RepID=A0ABS4Z1S0_9MICC|nr:LysM peptidoglycan-binding domain-containing protein [Arthrobacter stackebrandtii]MBP2414992.1 LysM repeat protein [Arthrobacter stackebrandtii]PYH00854.1 lytic transglycosylase [Arthrobacter stackebrandtii]